MKKYNVLTYLYVFCRNSHRRHFFPPAFVVFTFCTIFGVLLVTDYSNCVVLVCKLTAAIII